MQRRSKAFQRFFSFCALSIRSKVVSLFRVTALLQSPCISNPWALLDIKQVLRFQLFDREARCLVSPQKKAAPVRAAFFDSYSLVLRVPKVLSVAFFSLYGM